MEHKLKKEELDQTLTKGLEQIKDGNLYDFDEVFEELEKD